VLAHAYTPAAIRNAVQAGVRSIEHGNFLYEATAELMSAKGTFLVPTFVTYLREAARGGSRA
jgi:imidazolonepropionase-like amidohydrolase